MNASTSAADVRRRDTAGAAPPFPVGPSPRAPAIKVGSAASADAAPPLPRHVPRLSGWVRAGGLRSRTSLLVGGVAVLGAGMALNWSWLTAVGAAPVILSLAPCALMCTLGLCCTRGGGGS